MAAAPQYKIYTASGEYVAACKHPNDAGAIINLYGDGATIRNGHKMIVWREGHEAQPAGDSYDFVAETVFDRLTTSHQ